MPNINFDYMIGQKYGRLTVEKIIYQKGRGTQVDCICECGNRKQIRIYDVRKGHTQSCGCLRNEKVAKVNYKKGLAADDYRLYGIWSKVLYRCNNPKDKHYHYYGGRGIKVCDEWQGENGAENFFKWAYSHGYVEPLTLERIDVNGNYCPENCKWIPISEQPNNTRRTNHYTYKGETLTLNEFAKKYNVNVVMLRSRVYKLKWDIDRAIEEPRHERFDTYNESGRKNGGNRKVLPY